MTTMRRSVRRGVVTIAVGLLAFALLPAAPQLGALESATLVAWVALLLAATAPVEDRLLGCRPALAVAGLLGLWAATTAALLVAHLQVEWTGAVLRQGPTEGPAGLERALGWLVPGDVALAVATAWLAPVAVGMRLLHRRRAGSDEPRRSLALLDTVVTVLAGPLVMIPTAQVVERTGPLGARCMVLSLAGLLLLPALLTAGDALGERLATSRQA